MKFRVVPVFAKLFANVGFVKVIIHANTHIHQCLTKHSEGQKYGEQLFHDVKNSTANWEILMI